MSKMKQGIFGALSGKIGNVVGSSWKGIAVLKSLPASVTNPRSAGQVAQRTKLKNAVAFAQVILSSVIKPLWDRFASRQSGYNAFISRNIGLFTLLMPSPPEILIISSGKMASTAIDSVSVDSEGPNPSINWSNEAGSGFKLATDVAFGVCVNETQGTIGVLNSEKVRSELTASFTMPTNSHPGDTYRFYLAFRREDGSIVSDNSYFTEDVPV